MSGTFTRRTTVTDSNGKIWDLGNPDIIAIESSNSGTTTEITIASGSVFNAVPIAFTTASAAFTGS